MAHRLVPTSNRRFARAMRADANRAENMLWQAIRNKRLGGLKFGRQVPVAGYIVDFACFEARLVVEVDGGQHSGSTRDAERDALLAGAGFRTVRFWHDEVERNIDGVCMTILRAAGL